MHERFASKDPDENDKYLFKLRELANIHPELKNEYETFRIYQKWVFTGPVHGHRISIRFNWDNPPKNSLCGFQRYLH